ncbi:hypothetical protein SAMN05216486_101100 [bacterium JGI 053]|nr:hypothetical protein SAMN05216486_101100 [bacterium JGI 053]
MNRAQLEHAIRAACDVTNEDVVIVFGSQAILGTHPNASDQLRQSMECRVEGRGGAAPPLRLMFD